MSADGGNTWAAKTIPDLPMNAQFEAVSCTGHGKCAICTAAGYNVGTTEPFLSVSMDGGMSWEIKTFDNLPHPTSFNAASCTGNPGDAVCIAAGNGPALAVSNDGGNTWDVKTIPNHTGFLFGTSCTGIKSTAICSAAGEDWGGSKKLLVDSTNGGETWKLKSVAHIPSLTSFYTTSCTGSKKQAICIAAGGDLRMSPPSFNFSSR